MEKKKKNEKEIWWKPDVDGFRFLWYTDSEKKRNKREESMSFWEELKNKEAVVMYGMGDGAEKILRVLESKGVSVSDFFASDGFVRGQSFLGKRVKTLSEIRQSYPSFAIVSAFGSSLPDVMALFDALDKTDDLYIPDVSPCGGELFDDAFVSAHREEIASARSLLSDSRSREVFDAMIAYRLSGRLSDLKQSECDLGEVWESVLRQEDAVFVDAGAYRGDTAAEFIARRKAETIIAIEPDARSFQKCEAYLSSCGVAYEAHHAAAWEKDGTLSFAAKGSRASARSQNGKTVDIAARSIDSILGGRTVDYIKYDTEGAEKEAILGSTETIRACAPDLCVSLYHKSEDLFTLPLLIKTIQPEYRMYLRRFPYIPAWDLNLYCVKR